MLLSVGARLVLPLPLLCGTSAAGSVGSARCVWWVGCVGGVGLGSGAIPSRKRARDDMPEPIVPQAAASSRSALLLGRHHRLGHCSSCYRTLCCSGSSHRTRTEHMRHLPSPLGVLANYCSSLVGCSSCCSFHYAHQAASGAAAILRSSTLTVPTLCFLLRVTLPV